MIAVPVTIWSARSWMEKYAWTRASRPPDTMAISSPPNHDPVTSAPQIPKKAPISIMPSRPMFTTPLRSENMPPMAAKMSGVANASPSEISVDQVMTSLRLDALAWTANTPATIASAPLATAPQPTRRSPRVIAATPSSAEIAPRMSGAAMVSSVRGGSVSQSATGASAMPSMASRLGVMICAPACCGRGASARTLTAPSFLVPAP